MVYICLWHIWLHIYIQIKFYHILGKIYLIIHLFNSQKMSRANKQSQQPAKPRFDTKPYQRPGLNETDILEIKESFDIFDRDHLGSINPKEIKNALASLGPEAKNQAIYQVILDLDSEGAGNITFEQFIHLMTPRLLQGDSRENIDKIFALYDTEKVGFINVKDLRRISHSLGEDLTEQDLIEMIGRADADKDGSVSKEQFYLLLTSKGRQ